MRPLSAQPHPHVPQPARRVAGTAPRPGPNQRRTTPPRRSPGGAESKEKPGPFQSDTATRLRDTLRELIEAERDKSDAHYADVLSRALDYRNWYDFAVRVTDTGPDGRPGSRALRRLSSGETRLVSYLALFAAAIAFYDALETAGSTPLRLVLLDEAFERVDDPTKTGLLELLAELDIDWIITWPGGTVFSPKISRLHIYDVLRPPGTPGIAFVHTTWDGAEVQRI